MQGSQKVRQQMPKPRGVQGSSQQERRGASQAGVAGTASSGCGTHFWLSVIACRVGQPWLQHKASSHCTRA